jgi:hypothetical protein
MAWLFCVGWEVEVDVLLPAEKELVVEVSAGDEFHAGELSVGIEMHIIEELAPQVQGGPETEGRADEVIEVVTDTPIDCLGAVVVAGVKVGSVEVSGI